MVAPPEPGVVTCATCRWQFVSPDPERRRVCSQCHDRLESDPASRLRRVDNLTEHPRDPR